MKRNLHFKKQEKNLTNKIQIKENEVNNASTEIMLFRVFNGNKIEFPFSN